MITWRLELLRDITISSSIGSAPHEIDAKCSLDILRSMNMNVRIAPTPYN